MLSFKEFEIQDVKLMGNYILDHPYFLCDYNSKLVFLWRDYYKTKVAYDENYCYIMLTFNENEIKFLPPLGNKFVLDGVKKLIEYTDFYNIKLRFTCCDFKYKNEIESLHLDIVFLKEIGYENYIYDLEKLSTYKGKEYKGKRNLVNNFKNTYPTHKYISLNKNDYDLVEQFLDLWYQKRIDDDLMLIHERDVIKDCFNHFDELDIKANAILIDDKIIALAIGTVYNHIICEHVEKALTEYVGAYQAICMYFSESSLKYAKYMNKEEDLNIKGLRDAKISYNPLYIIDNYNSI